MAALSYQDRAFYLPMAGGEDRNAALAARDEFARRDFSDHLMLIRAYNAYSACRRSAGNGREWEVREWCQQHFLNPMVMNMVCSLTFCGNLFPSQLLYDYRSTASGASWWWSCADSAYCPPTATTRPRSLH